MFLALESHLIVLFRLFKQSSVLFTATLMKKGQNKCKIKSS